MKITTNVQLEHNVGAIIVGENRETTTAKFIQALKDEIADNIDY